MKSVATLATIGALLLIWSCVNPKADLGQKHEEQPCAQVTSAVQPVPLKNPEIVRGFTLNGSCNISLVIKSTVSPSLQISSYTSDTEQLTFIMGALTATGAGLALVAPFATVPAAVGPLANVGAGTAATGVAAGEAWTLDSLLGGTRARVLREVLDSVDLVANLQGALERFLNVKDIESTEIDGEMEVVINGYGFKTSLSKQANEACNFIDVSTHLRMPDRDLEMDSVFIGEGASRGDIPPAYCTDLERLVENNGFLARQAIVDSAEIAAAVIMQRLQQREP